MFPWWCSPRVGRPRSGSLDHDHLLRPQPFAPQDRRPAWRPGEKGGLHTLQMLSRSPPRWPGPSMKKALLVTPVTLFSPLLCLNLVLLTSSSRSEGG